MLQSFFFCQDKLLRDLFAWMSLLLDHAFVLSSNALHLPVASEILESATVPSLSPFCVRGLSSRVEPAVLGDRSALFPSPSATPQFLRPMMSHSARSCLGGRPFSREGGNSPQVWNPDATLDEKLRVLQTTPASCNAMAFECKKEPPSPAKLFSRARSFALNEPNTATSRGWKR